MVDLHKYAALEAPPAMVMDISNFCIGVLAKKMLLEIERIEKEAPRFLLYWHSDKITATKQYLEQQASKLKSKTVGYVNNQINYKAPINFDGWNPPKGTDVKQLKEFCKYFNKNYVNCLAGLFREGDNIHNWGLWDVASWSITINIKIPEINLKSIGTVPQHLRQSSLIIFDTVEHELIHMVQYLGNSVRRTLDFGYPPKAVRDYKIEDAYKPMQREVEHSSLDFEFYTNLTDAINYFYNVARFFPVEKRRELSRLFTGAISSMSLDKIPKYLHGFAKPNDFFEYLKNNNTQKWQVAVKRFMRYLDEHPGILT